ncbi:hypothetical protein [Spirillospora albida]|uniref:hypothetical protein n=1 Tax=Spirillospora albida TaxID=58123 RepID=UPI000565BF1D|nr:hypothetical protein [Spirillospora albida]
MYCSTCDDERAFEQPPCPDGHGGECPERVCTECGAAVFVGAPPVAPALVAAREAAPPGGAGIIPRQVKRAVA